MLIICESECKNDIRIAEQIGLINNRFNEYFDSYKLNEIWFYSLQFFLDSHPYTFYKFEIGPCR